MQRLLKKHNIHYAWAILGMCALALFCTSGLSVNAFTVYQPFLMDRIGLSNAESSLIITMRGLVSFLSVLLIGPFYKHFSLRVGLALAISAEAAGFLAFGASNSLEMCCVGSVLVGCGYGLGTMVPVAMLIDRWFIHRRTTALGICAAATGLSTIGIPNLITWAILTFGLSRAFVAEAAFILGCSALCLAIVRDSPESMDAKPYGLNDATPQAQDRKTARAPYGKMSWSVTFPALILLGAASTVAFSHLGMLAVSLGIQGQQAATAISMTGVALLCGKVLFGWIGDKRSASASTLVFGMMLFAGLAILCISSENVALFVLGSMAYGAGASLSSVGLMAWAADFSSPGEHDRNAQRFQLCFGAGGFIFSPFPGIVADACGGSYVPSFALFALMALFTTTAMLMQYRKARANGSQSFHTAVQNHTAL